MEDVFIVPDDARFGVVSDIDDTTMVTRVPTLALAVWNTLWVRSGSRKAVQGMPQLSRRLAAAHPDEPFIYLSAGAWNTQRVLRRFLSKHGYPVGPLLLTDFGPTRTGWFRSSRDHKQQSLDWLMKFFPQVTWLLVGDDGQLDPVVYAEAAARWPGRVAAIAIRTLTRAQRILVAAVPGRSIIGDDSANLSPIPIVQAHDGHTLAARLAALPGFNTGHV
jgi:phosphatidate phosphatase APP1